MWVILLIKRVVSLIVVPGWKLFRSPDVMSLTIRLRSRGTLGEVAVEVDAETEADVEAVGATGVGLAAGVSTAGGAAGGLAAVAGSS